MKFTVVYLLFFIFASSHSFADSNAVPKLGSNPNQKRKVVTCLDNSLNPLLVETYENVSEPCKKEGLFEIIDKVSECRTVSGEYLSLEDPWESGNSIVLLKYTRMQFTCGNSENPKPITITCKGKWVGQLKQCLKNEFSLENWVRKNDLLRKQNSEKPKQADPSPRNLKHKTNQ